jgi:hypothetical protein
VRLAARREGSPLCISLFAGRREVARSGCALSSPARRGRRGVDAPHAVDTCKPFDHRGVVGLKPEHKGKDELPSLLILNAGEVCPRRLRSSIPREVLAFQCLKDSHYQYLSLQVLCYRICSPSRGSSPTRHHSGRETILSCGAVLDHLRIAMTAFPWQDAVRRLGAQAFRVPGLCLTRGTGCKLVASSSTIDGCP